MGTDHEYSIVISIFGIIILSTIGAMFASNHHSMMGSTEDPKDGKKVAAAVFGAVVVYAVSVIPFRKARNEFAGSDAGRAGVTLARTTYQ